MFWVISLAYASAHKRVFILLQVGTLVPRRHDYTRTPEPEPFNLTLGMYLAAGGTYQAS